MLMRTHSKTSTSLIAAVVAAGVLVSMPVAGLGANDAWTVPRTADGRPDFQGVWANNGATPLERPEEWADKESLTREELKSLKEAALRATNGGEDALFGDQLIRAAIANEKATSYDPGTGNYNQFWVSVRTFDNRTSLIVDPPDGRIPALTEEATARFEAAAEHRKAHPADSYTDRRLSERCISYGVPRLGAGYNAYYKISQNADHVVILMEMIHDARVIPIDGQAPLDGSIRLWHGDSRGHWEGDTLVIETKNYSKKSGFRGSSENLHVTERLTLVGPNTLNYVVTIEDPDTWTAPWTVMIPLKETGEEIFEYACHEGNYGMEGILAGHRAKEREMTAQTATGSE
jgi:hypothetical protein